MNVDETKRSKTFSGWFNQNGWLALAIAGQLITLLITLPTWQVRETPVNLPLLDVPQIPYLWVVGIFVSAIVPWWFRKSGAWVHLIVLVLACCWDQFRIQPQFFFGWLFIWVASDLSLQCKNGLAVVVGRWALIGLWFWAGFHKLYSPDWMGVKSFDFLRRMGVRDWADDLYLIFAIGVGASELGLAMLAIWRPKLAAWGCVFLHSGILASLLMAQWNFSVFSWNTLAAALGFFLFSKHRWVFSWKEFTIAVLIMFPPALFYYGQVDRAFAVVLYSGMTPQGQITHSDGREVPIEKISGWGRLAVPFPAERRTLRQYFEVTADPGSKLHIRDKRVLLDDEYWVRTENGIVEISPSEFYSSFENQVVGSGYDDPASRFAMNLVEVERMKRDENSMVWAIAFEPGNYSRELLEKVAGYPNVEQIQLAGCPVTDEDLVLLSGLRRLQGIGLNQTNVTAKGLSELHDLPRLNLVQIEGTSITPQQLQAFFRNLDGQN